MKIVLAGAYGKLGLDIFKELLNQGHYVVAADLIEKDIKELDKSKYEFKKIDVTNKQSLNGLCDGADVVISTVGLTTSSAKLSNYDIDYQGNLNILEEAKKANVKNFAYVSVIRANEADDVPMVHAKYLFEEKLKDSKISYVIYRPTGYFYDIVKVFRPMIENGKVTLLGKKDVSANVIDTVDLAKFIVQTMQDNNQTYDIGGKETYTYREIANMCFKAAGKEGVIKTAPAWLFSMLASLPKNKKNGKWAVIKFSKFTLTHDMVGSTKFGDNSFKKYIDDSFKKGSN